MLVEPVDCPTQVYHCCAKASSFLPFSRRLPLTVMAESGVTFMALPPSKVEWHLARNGKEYGPLSDPELSKFIELGHLEPDDLLWREGFSDWQPAATLFPRQQEVLNARDTDHVVSSIKVEESLIAARSSNRRTTPRKALVLALFLIIVLGGAASYAYFWSDWPSVPSPTHPESFPTDNV